MEEEKLRKNTESITNAMNTRDASVVQLSEDDMSKGGSDELTVEEATQLLERLDVDTVTAAYINGNKEPWHALNSALVRLGAAELPPPTR